MHCTHSIRVNPNIKPLISFPIRRPQNALFPIKMEIPAAIPTQVLLNRASILKNPKQRHDTDDERDDRQVRMVCAEVSDLEEDVLKCADGGLWGKFGWVSDDSGQGSPGSRCAKA